jgi:uncharacterized protein
MDEPHAEEPAPLAVDHPLAGARYVELTTFRRTGVGVPTPVWFSPSGEDPRVFAAITVDGTGKTKRLAHTARVELRACDVRGRVQMGAPTYRGTARVARDPDGVAGVRRAVVAKYGLPARTSDLLDSIGSRVGLRRAPRAGILVVVEHKPVA